MSVGLRMGLNRYPDVELATVATVIGALAVALVAAAAEAPGRGVHAGQAWPFLLAGLLQPGIGQLLVIITRGIDLSVGSVLIALVLLGEPVRWPLLVGALLIVAGGVELARDRQRPGHVRRRGYVYAFVATILFSARDNLTRWLAGTTSVPPGVAAAAALAGGLLLVLAVLGPRVRERLSLRAMLPFLGVGVAFGLSYVSLFEAYYRGRVTVVSPLVATESLWGVALSLLLIRRTELVGRRVLIGAVLIVAGSGLIAAYAR